MNNMIKSIFGLIAFMLLAGCNSEGVFNSESEPKPPVITDATVVEISVTPSSISLFAGDTRKLVAMAKYDDGSEKDVSDSVTWEIVGDPTIAGLFGSGFVMGYTRGDTELTTSKDGITSNTVTIKVCNTGDACLDIFDTGSGKLFTNSPSVAYLESIGDSGGSAATNGTFNEVSLNGPANGAFYLFDWSNAHALCDTYNRHSLSGRTNWRLATRDELKVDLYDVHGSMFSLRHWPTSNGYISATLGGYNQYNVNLASGEVYSVSSNNPKYASCVSNP